MDLCDDRLMHILLLYMFYFVFNAHPIAIYALVSNAHLIVTSLFGWKSADCIATPQGRETSAQLFRHLQRKFAPKSSAFFLTSLRQLKF